MAILSDNALDFISSNLQQTVRLGIRLGELLRPGHIICLYGGLGAGKTALARGIGRGWGTVVRVTSPSFTLVNEYPRAKDGVVLYHMDFYRIAAADEAITTGLEDLLDQQGVFLIEWPQVVEPFLPADRMSIELRYVTEFKRGMHFEANGPLSVSLLQAFRRSAFGF